MNEETIEINDSIVLDNNIEYLVSSIAIYDGIEYLFLVNNDELSMRIAALTGNKVVMLDNKEDKGLIKKLMPLFLQNASDKYQDIANDQD